MKSVVKAKAIFDRTVDLLASVAGALIIFTMLLICIAVVMRYFLNCPILWAELVSGAMLLYLTFLSATWILKREGHVKVDILLSRLNPRTQAMLGIISSIIGVVICLFLIVYGIEMTWYHFQEGIRIIGIVPVPKAPIMVIIPICGLPLLIQFVRRGFGYLEGWRVSSNKNQGS